MLPRELSFFYMQILTESLQSFATAIAIILLIIAVFAAKLFTGNTQKWLFSGRLALIVCSIALLIYSFYATVLDIPENLELLEVAKQYPDDADCGTAMTGFYMAGIGLPNTCRKGCYRGLTLRRQMKMTGFPPVPQYNREIQCWVRKDPQKSVIPEKYQSLIR